MPGTDVALRSIGLHAHARRSYAVSGTDIGVCGTDIGVSGTDIEVCYAVSGTDLGYGSTSRAGRRRQGAGRRPPPKILLPHLLWFAGGVTIDGLGVHGAGKGAQEREKDFAMDVEAERGEGAESAGGERGEGGGAEGREGGREEGGERREGGREG
eukprot:1144435-Rhodomonas_salina.1